MSAVAPSAVIGWWNVQNVFDDEDDPQTRDPVRSRHAYLRDIAELAEVLGSGPCCDLIGLGEVENEGVLSELCDELRWHPARRDYAVPAHFDSRDPRGIDVGVIARRDGALHVERCEALYPVGARAARPVVLVHCRLGGHALRVVYLHSKSRRSGDSHAADPTPGSAQRFAYGRLLRGLAVDAGGDGVPLVVLGDMNDEPGSPSLVHTQAAHARSGRDGGIDAGRLYNLTLEARGDSPGTHCMGGRWAYLDQLLVGGVLLQQGGAVGLDGRLHIRSDGPLLHGGRPNRWYSDHLPLWLRLSAG